MLDVGPKNSMKQSDNCQNSVSYKKMCQKTVRNVGNPDRAEIPTMILCSCSIFVKRGEGPRATPQSN